MRSRPPQWRSAHLVERPAVCATSLLGPRSLSSVESLAVVFFPRMIVIVLLHVV